MPSVFVIAEFFYQAESHEEAARMHVAEHKIQPGDVFRVVDWDCNVEYFEAISTAKYGMSPVA